MFWRPSGRKSYLEGEVSSIPFLGAHDPTAESSLDRSGKSSKPLHYFGSKTPAEYQSSCGHAALPMTRGRSFSDPSAFDVKALVNLIFLPLTLDCLQSDKPQSGAIL
jgi:hypothetical protein